MSSVVVAAVGAGIFVDGWFNWLTVTFFSVLIVWFGVMIGFVIKYGRRLSHRRISLQRVARKAEEASGHINRRMLRQVAQRADPKVIGPLWEEFDETLVTTPDGEHTYNTVDASYFFDAQALAVEFSRNRILAATPGMLAAFGVFGTFLTLTFGLTGLDLNGSPAALASGVANLIGAASFAFAKSVAGVGLSLIFTVIVKGIEGHVAKVVVPLQQQIDSAFERVTPESSLVQVSEFTRASKESLQELHERIGDRLQETVQTLSKEMVSAIDGAIRTAMMPSMAELAEVATHESHDVFESLVDKFATSFTELGQNQRALMDEASSRLTTSVDAVGELLATTAERSHAFTEDVMRRQTELLASVEATDRALTVSSERLTASAQALEGVGTAIQESSAQLSGGLTQTSATLLALFEKVTAEAEVLDGVRERIGAGEASLTDAAKILTDATAQFAGHLGALALEHDRFEKAVRVEVDATATALREHVAALEKQVGQWLGAYGRDVEKQIESRMEVWNMHSRDYADHMLATSRALAQVVDEIQSTIADRELEADSAGPADQVVTADLKVAHTSLLDPVGVGDGAEDHR